MKKSEDMHFLPELLKRIESCTTADEILALAKENHVEMTAEEAAGVLSSMKRELTDEEIGSISCGKFWEPIGSDDSES